MGGVATSNSRHSRGSNRESSDFFCFKIKGNAAGFPLKTCGNDEREEYDKKGNGKGLNFFRNKN